MIQRRTLAEPWEELLETAVEGTPPLYVYTEKAGAEQKPIGEIIGYVIVITDTDEVLYIPELAVDPPRQGERIGSQLLEFVFDQFEGYDRARLTVEATDEQARAFYTRHGFEVLERLEDNFESGDGLLVEKQLQNEG